MNREKIKNKLDIIIFGTDTRAGKLYDVALLMVIIASVFTVIIYSLPNKTIFSFMTSSNIEWGFTAFFGIDYILRIWVSKEKKNYLFSFWGLIDFIALLPSILMIFLSGVHFLAVIRGLRLLRVFRILKLTRYTAESMLLIEAIRNSMKKIIVFLMFVLIAAIIMGTFMYVVEGRLAASNFKTIPDSIYWAIVTITTVGYGDIAPQTILGKFVASVLMLIGYGVIAIPTGIVTSEIVISKNENETACSNCGAKIESTHNFCSDCGFALKQH